MKKFIRRWPEIWSVPVAWILWEWSPYLLQLLDPFAAPFPTGEIQRVLFALAAMVAINGIVFAGIKFNWPTLFGFYSHFSFKSQWDELNPTSKFWLLLCLYLGLFLCAVVLTTAF